MYYHPSSTGGPNVWDFSATPGLATEFIASNGRTGKTVRDLFKHGMKSLLPKYEESHITQSETINQPSDQFSTERTVQTPLYESSMTALMNTLATPTITKQSPALPVPSNQSSNQSLVSPPSVPPAKTNKRRVTIGHQVATTNPLDITSENSLQHLQTHEPIIISNQLLQANQQSVAQTKLVPASQQQLPSLKGNTSDPTTTLTAGRLINPYEVTKMPYEVTNVSYKCYKNANTYSSLSSSLSPYTRIGSNCQSYAFCSNFVHLYALYRYCGLVE